MSFLWYIFCSHDYYTNTKRSLKRSNIIFGGNSYIISTTSCPRMIKFLNIMSLSIRCWLYWLIISNSKWKMHYHHTCNILLNEKSIRKFHLFWRTAFSIKVLRLNYASKLLVIDLILFLEVSKTSRVRHLQ